MALVRESRLYMQNLLVIFYHLPAYSTKQSGKKVEISSANRLSWDKIFNGERLMMKGIEHILWFFFFFWLCPQHVEVPRPKNPHHSSNPSSLSDNARSSTHCSTRELLFCHSDWLELMIFNSLSSLKTSSHQECFTTIFNRGEMMLFSGISFKKGIALGEVVFIWVRHWSTWFGKLMIYKSWVGSGSWRGKEREQPEG